MTKEEYWQKYVWLELYRNYYDEFDIWWDPDRFNWKLNSDDLCQFLPDKFDIWWNTNLFTNKFNWNNSNYLCKYLPHKFDIWWNPEKFNWYFVWALVKYVPDKVETWWDIEKFAKYNPEKYNLHYRDVIVDSSNIKYF